MLHYCSVTDMQRTLDFVSSIFRQTSNWTSWRPQPHRIVSINKDLPTPSSRRKSRALQLKKMKNEAWIYLKKSKITHSVAIPSTRCIRRLVIHPKQLQSLMQLPSTSITDVRRIGKDQNVRMAFERRFLRTDLKEIYTDFICEIHLLPMFCN